MTCCLKGFIPLAFTADYMFHIHLTVVWLLLSERRLFSVSYRTERWSQVFDFLVGALFHASVSFICNSQTGVFCISENI